MNAYICFFFLIFLPALKVSRNFRFPISDGIAPLSLLSPFPTQINATTRLKQCYLIRIIYKLTQKILKKILPTSTTCNDVTFPISDGICPVNSLPS